MKYLHWFAAAVVFGICGSPLQAAATPKNLETNPVTMAEALAVDRHSQESLNRLANQVGQQVGQQGSSDGAELAESLNLPLLNDLLDESGELRLPLGLMVYDAMGTTSVGFGSRF